MDSTEQQRYKNAKRSWSRLGRIYHGKYDDEEDENETWKKYALYGGIAIGFVAAAIIGVYMYKNYYSDEALSKKKSQLQSQVNSLKADVAMHKEKALEHAPLKSKNDQLLFENQLMQQQITDWKDKYQSYRQDTTRTRDSRIEDLQKENDSYFQDNQDMKNKLRTLERDNTNYLHQLNTQKQETVKLKQNFDTFRGETKRERVNDKEAMRQLKTKMDIQKNEFHHEIKNWEDRLAACRKSQDTHIATDVRIESLQKQNETYMEQQQNMEHAIRELERKNKSYVDTIAVWESKHTELKESFDNFCEQTEIERGNEKLEMETLKTQINEQRLKVIQADEWKEALDKINNENVKREQMSKMRWEVALKSFGFGDGVGRNLLLGFWWMSPVFSVFGHIFLPESDKARESSQKWTQFHLITWLLSVGAGFIYFTPKNLPMESPTTATNEIPKEMKDPN